MRKKADIYKILSLVLVLSAVGCTGKTDNFIDDSYMEREVSEENVTETNEELNKENLPEETDTNDETNTDTTAEFPEPLVLSGNPDDVIETEDYEYIIGEKCVIFVDKGCKINGDLLVVIEDIMTELENQTGMTFNNDSIYNNEEINGRIESYFGADYWNGYRGGDERINIILTNDSERKGLVSYATGRATVFVNPNFKIHKYGIGPVVHELSHVLQMSNHDYYHDKLSEGFAAYWEVNLVKNLPQYAMPEEDPDEKYFGFHSEDLNAQNAETIFLKDYDRMDGNQPYEYGFGLMTFLYETYSSEEVNNFYDYLDEKLLAERSSQLNEDLSDEELLYNIYDPGSLEFEANILKEYFGEDIFQKFGKWYSDNNKRFL